MTGDEKPPADWRILPCWGEGVPERTRVPPLLFVQVQERAHWVGRAGLICASLLVAALSYYGERWVSRLIGERLFGPGIVVAGVFAMYFRGMIYNAVELWAWRREVAFRRHFGRWRRVEEPHRW